jgi:hypothetical protein
MASNMEWHTDLKAFLLDNLNFIVEQLELAQNDPSDRRAAVDAARGIVPLLRERLCGLDDPLQATFMLLASQWWADNHWTETWDQLNKADQFDAQARSLISVINVFRRELLA